MSAVDYCLSRSLWPPFLKRHWAYAIKTLRQRVPIRSALLNVPRFMCGLVKERRKGRKRRERNDRYCHVIQLLKGLDWYFILACYEPVAATT
jgi:hypothetical protein